MKQNIFKKSLFPVFIIILLYACTCNTPTTSDDRGIQVSSQTISDSFAIVNCTREEFLKLKPWPEQGRVKNGSLFIKPFISKKGVVFHAWQFRAKGTPQDSSFTPTPNIEFNFVRKSVATFGEGSYIGDFIISNKVVSQIYSALEADTTIKFVVFTPTQSSKFGVILTPSISHSPTGLEQDFNPKDYPEGTVFKTMSFEDAYPIPPGGGSIIESNQ